MMPIDSTSAEMYIQNAMEDYEKWGAKAKVEALKRKYPSINIEDTECGRSDHSTTTLNSRKYTGSSAFKKVELTASLCQ